MGVNAGFNSDQIFTHFLFIMFLATDHDHNYQLNGEVSVNVISNGANLGGSGGSLSNPMYQQVCCKGIYSSHSGRSKLRFTQKKRGVCLSKKKQFFQL